SARRNKYCQRREISSSNGWRDRWYCGRNLASASAACLQISDGLPRSGSFSSGGATGGSIFDSTGGGVGSVFGGLSGSMFLSLLPFAARRLRRSSAPARDFFSGSGFSSRTGSFGGEGGEAMAAGAGGGFGAAFSATTRADGIGDRDINR